MFFKIFFDNNIPIFYQPYEISSELPYSFDLSPINQYSKKDSPLCSNIIVHKNNLYSKSILTQSEFNSLNINEDISKAYYLLKKINELYLDFSYVKNNYHLFYNLYQYTDLFKSINKDNYQLILNTFKQGYNSALSIGDTVLFKDEQLTVLSLRDNLVFCSNRKWISIKYLSILKTYFINEIMDLLYYLSYQFEFDDLRFHKYRKGDKVNFKGSFYIIDKYLSFNFKTICGTFLQENTFSLVDASQYKFEKHALF